MTIRRDALDSVVAHARGQWPRECCGILMAEGRGRDVVTSALAAENAEAACPERAYVVGHEAHLRAVEREIEGTARIAGYYHSHPRGAPRPSARDAELAHESALYLIVGLRAGAAEPAAWRFDGRGFVHEPLTQVD